MLPMIFISEFLKGLSVKTPKEILQESSNTKSQIELTLEDVLFLISKLEGIVDNHQLQLSKKIKQLSWVAAALSVLVVGQTAAIILFQLS